MKKIKLFLAAMAAMVGLSVNAQEDITSTYLTNADLSSKDGWTITGEIAGTLDTSMDVNAIEFYHSWSANPGTAIGNSKSFRFSQVVNLPAGDYRIAVNAFYREGNGNGTNTKAYIFAGETQKYIHAVTAAENSELQNGNGKYKNAKVKNDMGRAAYAFSIGDFEEAFDFTVTEAGAIELGFNGYIDTYCSWCIFGPMKLYKYSLDDYLVDYDAKYADAEGLDGQPMNADVQTALTAAMVDRNTFTLTSQVTAAIATLTTAINNASNSVASYAAIKAQMDKALLFDSYGTAAYEAADGVSEAIAAYNNRTATDGVTEIAAMKAAFNTGVLATKQPGNGLDMTAYITNPDFDGGNYDGWTRYIPYGGNCAIQGDSRMEYWAGNASDRAAATFDIYQEIENLPAGVYTISADMYNSLNGEGGDYTVFSPTCGVYGSSSNEEVALVDVEGDVLNTYTTGEVLYFRGKLRIGTKNTVTPIAARWFLFDNVKLTYARQLTQEEIDANTIPESITLDQTNVSIQTGRTATLTATILPENANDKTITWTSSDVTVASVAGGVVTALKPGTATITAIANGADDVQTTATITVADAPAPAFFTTELTDGDYYIMNAATGQFLGGGNDWGTHASIIEHGIPFGLKVGDGVYTLDSYTYNNANDHFMGGSYIDASSTNLYINSIGDGKFSISTADGSAFISAWAGNTYVSNEAADASSTYAQWYFISKKDRDKTLAAATNENPVDATYYVKQANISRNLSAGGYNVNAWSQYDVGGTQNNTNFAAQVYNAAVDNYQTIENIPNGTYTVTVQAFTSGTDVKFYANDEKVDVKANDSGVGSCSGAAALFAQNKYPNTVTVTVTDRTLKIGFEGDCSGAKWLCYDKVEMYMTSYTANTGVSASIDNAEIEAGTTAQITAATEPATASFNAITYASSDETVATVDENGLVTGLKIGTATITVAANEMENFSTTVEVTVVAVTPTALAFETSEIALNKETATATLVLVPTPADANTSVTWTSSDETVATVADGVVTAVSTGTATITATSTLDELVSATATINVTFPESSYETSTYVNEGASRTVTTLGENLIKNGAFEYPDSYYGWTNGAGGKLAAANFDIVTDGDNKYLRAKNSQGAGNANSISTGWPIESGKTYVFGYKIKANDNGNSQFHVVSLTNTIGTETAKISDDATPITTDWTDVKYKFTNTDGYAFVQFRARWLASNQSYDDFYLVEVTGEETVGNVQYALDAIPTANIGTGAFQYSQDAIDAANALVQGVASVADVEAAYEAVTTLNAPEDGKIYNIVVAEEGNAKIGNAVVITTGATSANNPTGYGLNVSLAPNTNLNQAVTFTKESGNNYYISFETAAGTTYLTTGSLNGSAAGWNKQQIQATTEADKKCAFTIVASAEDDIFYIYNPEYKDYIDYQEGGSLYTDTNIDHKSFSLVETAKPSITINTTAAGWGTVMLPFAVAELPENVKAYSVSELKDDQEELDLVEVTALEANKPYIIEGAWEETLTGDAQGTALNYTDGLLTGTYERIAAPNESYILQKQNDVVGFYQVDTNEAQPNVPANRAYLTVPAAGVKAFFLGNDTDAIKSVFDGVAAGDIYDLAGRKVAKMQKGNVYIVNGKKVLVK